MDQEKTSERMEILKMLSEGKISVDEAERLLKALEDSYTKSSDTHHQSHKTRPRREWHEGLPFEDFFSHLDSRIRGFFGDFQEKDIFPDFMNIFRGEKGSAPESHEIVLSPGMIVTINMLGRSNKIWHRFQGGDITITKGSSDTVQLNPEETPTVFFKDNHCLILAETKDLSLELPDHIKQLNCFSSGGDIEISGMPVSLQCKTLGGNISIKEPKGKLDLKTMGGNIEIESWEATEGSSKIISMGGDLYTRFCSNVSIKLKAHSVGGRIKTNFESSTDKYQIPFMLETYEGTLGSGAAQARFETAGGNITLDIDEEKE